MAGLVTAAELARHLRIDDPQAEKKLLEEYADAARAAAEAIMRRPVYEPGNARSLLSSEKDPIPAPLRLFIYTYVADLYKYREQGQEKPLTRYHAHLLDQYIDYDG